MIEGMMQTQQKSLENKKETEAAGGRRAERSEKDKTNQQRIRTSTWKVCSLDDRE